MCTKQCLPIAQLDKTTYSVCSSGTQELHTQSYMTQCFFLGMTQCFAWWTGLPHDVLKSLPNVHIYMTPMSIPKPLKCDPDIDCSDMINTYL